MRVLQQSGGGLSLDLGKDGQRPANPEQLSDTSEGQYPEDS